MAVYVGRWDCGSCGHKGILGPETECSKCGADRPKDVRFYMADESDIVQDTEELKRAKSGADWRCSFCNNNNKAWETVCSSCGNVKNSTSGDEQLKTRTYTNENVPKSGQTPPQRTNPSIPQKQQKPKRKVGCFIALAIAIGLFFLLGMNNEIIVTVESFEWERTIAVEESREVTEEDWSLPSEGKLMNSFEAVHHYDQVLDHYETRTRTVQRAAGTEQYVCGKKDLGNGYFEDQYCTRTVYESYDEQYEAPVYRDEPVYRTKYRYRIYRWFEIAPIKTQAQNQQPEWGNIAHVQRNQFLREKQRSGLYTTIVRDEENEVHREELPESQWKRLKVGDELKAKRGLLGDYRGLAP